MFDSNLMIKVHWKDHASIMASNFIKLLQHEQFLDVHIRHGDRTISAHRAVLASSSDLFRAQLASPASAVTSVELSSLLCASVLREKSFELVFSELELIVHIVYRGWVDLRERSIASVLDTARCLQFTDVCEVLQRTVQRRASAQQALHAQHLQQAQHTQHAHETHYALQAPQARPVHQLPHTQQQPQQQQQPPPPQQPAGVVAPPPPPPGVECLEQLAGGEVTLRALHDVLMASERSCLLAPELAELAHLAPLQLAPVERRLDPPPPPVVGSALRHEDAAELTAAGLCEVVETPPTSADLVHQQPPLPTVSAAGEAVVRSADHQPPQEQQLEQEQEQGRPPGSQDGAPLLRVRTQFELHCPWGVDMEMAGRGRQESEQGSAVWPHVLMPAPLPPGAPAAAPPLPVVGGGGGGGGGLVVDEEQAIIDSCGLPPSTPETVDRFDENDFSGLTEEEKSPMPPKTARVRRVRRRAARVRVRRLPALISLDQSTVCQVCHRDFGRMAALQRHLAAEHRPGPPASTVDASAIADPRVTCASLLQFRPRLTAPETEPTAPCPPAGAGGHQQTVAAGFGAEDGGGDRLSSPGEDAGLLGEAASDLPLEKSAFDAATAVQKGGAGVRQGAPEPDRPPVETAPNCGVTPTTEGAVLQADTASMVEAAHPAGHTSAAVDVPLEFKCGECAFSAVTEPLLRSHVKREHSAALLCPHCQLQFRQAASLYRHVATAHPGQPGRPTQCRLCSYRSDRPSQVRRHLRDVHGQDAHGRALPLDHRCQQCDYVSCSALKLKVHVRRQHVTDKQFKCSECPYSSVEKQALAKHFRIVHTDDRPYRCEICDFRTSTLSRITRHRRSHTRERPHVCGTCGQPYADRRRLREHIRQRHEPAGGAEPLPFVCHVCGKAFARRDNMVQHIGNRHKAV